MASFNTHLTILSAAGLAVYASIASAAEPTPGAAATAEILNPNRPSGIPVLIDIRKDLGCGKKGLSDAERTERNRRIIYNYVQSSHEFPKHHKLYNQAYHGCWTDTVRIRAGTFTPAAVPKPDPNMKKLDWDSESTGLVRVYPDFGCRPDTLKLHAFVDGVYYSVLCSGHHKDTGKYATIWEAGLMLTNEEGKVILWDFWDDPEGWKEITQNAWGIDPKDFSLKTYSKAVLAEPLKGKK